MGAPGWSGERVLGDCPRSTLAILGRPAPTILAPEGMAGALLIILARSLFIVLPNVQGPPLDYYEWRVTAQLVINLAVMVPAILSLQLITIDVWGPLLGSVGDDGDRPLPWLSGGAGATNGLPEPPIADGCDRKAVDPPRGSASSRAIPAHKTVLISSGSDCRRPRETRTAVSTPGYLVPLSGTVVLER